MKLNLSAILAGALFGAGLCVSGMTDPAKVIGFLDLFGAWDPSLAFVMVGAIGVHLAVYRVVRGRPSPLFDARFRLPEREVVDARLVAGSALFGAGWGVAGYCPGPGIVAAATFATPALVFVGTMAAGMLLHHLAFGRLASAPRVLQTE